MDQARMATAPAAPQIMRIIFSADCKCCARVRRCIRQCPCQPRQTAWHACIRRALPPRAPVASGRQTPGAMVDSARSRARGNRCLRRIGSLSSLARVKCWILAILSSVLAVQFPGLRADNPSSTARGAAPVGQAYFSSLPTRYKDCPWLQPRNVPPMLLS